jgi:hypothetical protein
MSLSQSKALVIVRRFTSHRGGGGYIELTGPIETTWNSRRPCSSVSWRKEKIDEEYQQSEWTPYTSYFLSY